MKDNIFSDIKVLDLSKTMAGPICGRLLARFGAEVIKIEAPVTGDDTRAMPPDLKGVSVSFMLYNAGKKSVVLDLKDPEAIEMIKTIVKDVDVVLESFRPGVMKKLGLDYETLKAVNPAIIFCSISTYGQFGPYSPFPGYDIIAQAESGFMDMQGDPDGMPVKAGCMLGDEVGAINAYASIAAALYYKEKTGKGQYIDVALFDGFVGLNGAVSTVTVYGQDPHRSGPHHTHSVPYGVFEGKNNQYLVIVAPTPKLWKQLSLAMNRPELNDHAMYKTSPLRMENKSACIKEIEIWLQQFDDISEAEAILKKFEVPVAQVKSTKQMCEDPHVKARDMITELPTTKSVQAAGIPSFRHKGAVVKMSETPEDLSLVPPDLGEHNEEILGRYGWSREKIAEIQAKWEARNRA
jgi:crotonobetainyl-CoA:carnitine CoA-transferase CaiB-like acyl-CoA transferase